jgi:RimJ/RimL family protein N-acetyltransferase
MDNLQIQLHLWADSDLDLLHRINEPEMMAHLGGPETEEQIITRHKRYLQLTDGQMFCISVEQQAVGSIGYWTRRWQGEMVYEMGWSVLSSYQGKGIATAAVAAALKRANNEQKYRFVHAFPSVKNIASNAICRKLSFSFVSECSFEYPVGHFMQCNNWRFDLRSLQS